MYFSTSIVLEHHSFGVKLKFEDPAALRSVSLPTILGFIYSIKMFSRSVLAARSS